MGTCYRSALFTIIFCLCFNHQIAQSFKKDYQPIKSVGYIPDIFTLNTTKKIQGDLKGIEEKDRKLNKQEQNFTIHSNYAIDNQLHGGNILLNDDITIYVGKIADQLLKNNPVLRGQLKIFITKMPEVNAHCMAKGYLFINIGLIAKAENEAQLAYILAHEISHFVKKHGLNTYLQNKKIDKEYRVKTFEDRLINKLSFSKENEMEADFYGFELFKSSDYYINEAITAFDVLKYSYLPIEEIPLDSSFFNDEYYKIPSKYYLKEVQKIKDKEDYDDTKSTHPNIAKRKDKIRALIDSVNIESKKKFIVSETDFIKVRDIARFELNRLYLVERNYLNSIVTAYILLKKYPENLYLKKIISKSLYAMSLYKDGVMIYNEDSYRKAPIPDYTKTEGYSQQMNYILDKLPKKEFVILSLKYVWKNHIEYPHDPLFINLSDSLFSMLTEKYKMRFEDFYSDEGTKIVTTDSDLYYKYAFVNNIRNDNEFKEKFKLLSSKISNNKSDVGLKPFSLPTKNDKKNKNIKVLSNKLNIQKVIIIDPFYKKIDQTIPETSIYSVTDRRQEDLLQFIKINANKYKIVIDLIDPGSFASKNIDLFNDFSVFNDWFNERMEGGEMQNCTVFNSDEIPDLISKYGTKYFLWSGVFSIKYHEKTGTFQHYIDTYYYSILFDIETGKIINKTFTHSVKNDFGFRINDYVEATFEAISKK